MRIDATMTAQQVRPELLSGRTAIVIDVLRATSTMATALSYGIKQIIPVTSPEEAFSVASTIPAGERLLGGERGGLKVPGFDLGNSPSEYTTTNVRGKTLVMTTTNGTLAISKSAAASRVYTASLLNAYAVARQMIAGRGDVMLVCSGTQGNLSLEDVYCAGLLANEAKTALGDGVSLSDAAMACLVLFSAYSTEPETLMRLAEHGRHLWEIGFGHDVRYCAQVGVLDSVPVLSGGRIVEGSLEQRSEG